MEFLDFTVSRHALQELALSTPFTSRGADSENNVTIIPESFLTPSPEEEIIRRRSMPAVRPLFGRPQDTPPAKGMLSDNSRKRLIMSPSELYASPMKSYNSPKRQRLQRKSLDVPLRVELNGYSPEQLVSVIDKLVLRYPDLEGEVRESLPKPDLAHIKKNIAYLHKNIYRAMPSKRWASSRDAFCFSRVKTHIIVFKRAVLDHGKLLEKAQCWEALVKYVLMAYKFVSQMPVWDDAGHNETQKICYKNLAHRCMVALKSSTFEKETYRDIIENLKATVKLNDEIVPCLKKVEEILLTLE